MIRPVPINRFGTYSASVSARAGDGATASGSGSVIVGAAQGGCPPP